MSVLYTPMCALTLLGLVLAGGEIASRSAVVRSHLATPSVGSPSRLFELQLSKLDTLVGREGGIDCLFLGNSMVLLGLDPDAFDAAYEAHTGRSYAVESWPFLPVLLLFTVASFAIAPAEDPRGWCARRTAWDEVADAVLEEFRMALSKS